MQAVLAGGGQVVDGAGESVGRILRVPREERTIDPAHAVVACGRCGDASVVPLARAWALDGCLHVPYTAADVCGAPRVGAAGFPTAQLADAVRRYYSLLDDRAATDPAATAEPRPRASTSAAGAPWRREWRWPADPEVLRAVRLELRPLLRLSGLSEDQLEDLLLAAGEAAANAVEHAQRPTLPYFDVFIEVGEGRACIVIQDHGGWRAPTDAGHRGRGLQMIGSLADATLTAGSRGTTVVIRNRPGPGA
jgi:anti-sigma regulatory factor (Ser/Thr protein kinase)